MSIGEIKRVVYQNLLSIGASDDRIKKVMLDISAVAEPDRERIRFQKQDLAELL